MTALPLPKHIVISHVYSSDNKGDAALTSVLIQELRRVFPGVEITILRLELNTSDGYFEGVPEKPSFMYYALNKYQNPLFKLIYTLAMVSMTLLWALCYRLTGCSLYLPTELRYVAEAYQQADLIVPVGGGYLRSRKGLRNRLNIPLLVHPLLFGSLLGKPTILYSQSMGPFQNKAEKALVAFVLRRMTLILLREDTSMALLATMGVTRNVSRAIDAGFLLKGTDTIDIRKVYHISDRALLVGVTVRSWLSGEAQAKYERAVAKTLDDLVEVSRAHIVFIPQVTATKGDDDRVVGQRVYDFMRQKKAATLITDTPDHHQIKAIYDNLDILIGTRFHSVIFSLTSFVPTLAIEYEHKTSGIMHDLQLDRWVIKIEDATAEKLTHLAHELVQQQDVYRAHLRHCLPPYVRQARKTAELLSRSYFTSGK